MSTEITGRPSADRLREFVVVLEQGSISAAARRLDIPRATLSRRLSALESSLGVRLLHRETRRLVATDAGEQLFARARRIVTETDETWAALRRLDDKPRGPLRVSTHFSQRARVLFAAFAKDFPEVRLEVSATQRHVDLVAEGIDVAIRGGPIPDSDLIVRRLSSDTTVACACADYLERRGVPRSPKDLADHDVIVGFRGGHVPSQTWPLTRGGEVTVPHALASSDMRLRIEWALAGLGIALAPFGLVEPHINSGRLVQVLSGKISAPAPLSLVYVDRKHQAPQVRVFIEYAARFFGPPTKPTP
ncbi:MAG: LysR family transcriptional regulator [Nannocystales bacterium]